MPRPLSWRGHNKRKIWVRTQDFCTYHIYVQKPPLNTHANVSIIYLHTLCIGAVKTMASMPFCAVRPSLRCSTIRQVPKSCVLAFLWCAVKPVYNPRSQKDQKLFFKTNYCFMQVKSIAECSKGSILQYFWPALSYHFLIFCLFDLILSSHQQSFSWTGTSLLGLNQY